MPSLPLTVVQQYHPDIYSWADRTKLAGGSVSGFVVTALNSYVYTLLNAGIWQKMQTQNGMVLPFASNDLKGANVPLIRPGNVTPVNVGVDTYSLSSGYRVNNGGDKYLNTGWIPASNLLWGLSAQISIWFSAVPENTGLLAGMQTYGGAKRFALQNYDSLSTYDFDAFFYNSTGRVSATGISSPKFISGSRISANRADVYSNGVSVGSSTTTADDLRSSLITHPVWIGGWNNSGAVPQYTTRFTCGYFYIGTGLSAAEEAIHYTAVSAFQFALGRPGHT